jgi:organic radical activating enzyme
MRAVAPAVDADLIAIEHAQESSSTYTHVEWMLGNTCTYACSYCPAKLHDGSIPWLNYDKVLAFIAKLDAHYTKLHKRIWLQFTGGEPTIYPKFLELIEECRRRGFRQSVISNGVRTLRFWDQAAALLDYIILTYHIEYVDQSHFFKVVDRVRREARIHINVTMLPEQFIACRRAAQALFDTFEDVSVTMKPLRKDFAHDLYDYSRVELEVLGRQFGRGRMTDRPTPRSLMTKVFRDGRRTEQWANAFIIKRENRWQGWGCAAGMEAVRIMADGKVYRSACRVGGPLGTIETGVELPSDFITFDRSRCSCISDILLTKVRG